MSNADLSKIRFLTSLNNENQKVLITEERGGEICSIRLHADISLLQTSLQRQLIGAAQHELTKNVPSYEPKTPEDQFALAKDYAEGRTVPQNLPKAAYWYRQAAINGHAGAQEALAECYRKGLGVTVNLQQAKTWSEVASHNRKNETGTTTIQNTGSQHKKASADMKRDPEPKTPEEQFALAEDYAKGNDVLGILRNSVKAAYWYRQAAMNGHAGAQEALAECYREGLGVTVNLQQAKTWSEVASHTRKNQVGSSVVQNKGKQQKETSTGDSSYFEPKTPEDQFSLAEDYAEGKTVPQNPVKAAYWYRQAANSGHHGAQLALADCYRRGFGVSINQGQAELWSNVARSTFLKETENSYAFSKIVNGKMSTSAETPATVISTSPPRFFNSPMDYNAFWQGRNVLATAWNRYFILQPDGTVLVLGNDRKLIESSRSWGQVVSVSTGDWDAVARLRKDGTVGSNLKSGFFSAPPTRKWRNIKSIAMSKGVVPFVIGLKENGSVVSTNTNSSGDLSPADGWTRLAAVVAGDGFTAGLRKSGTVLVDSGSNNIKHGLLESASWTSIASISAGKNHLVGLRNDGTVVACGDNKYGQCNVKSWRNIVSIYAKDRYTLGLKQDGTMYITNIIISSDHVRPGREESLVESSSKLVKEVSKWKNVITVSDGVNGLLALQANGYILCAGIYPGYDLGSLEKNTIETWKQAMTIMDNK